MKRVPRLLGLNLITLLASLPVATTALSQKIPPASGVINVKVHGAFDNDTSAIRAAAQSPHSGEGRYATPRSSREGDRATGRFIDSRSHRPS